VARSLFQQRRTALFATLLTGFNMHFYVQSRIAMLDGFMVCFLVWGLVFLQSALKREQPGDARATTSFWAASGICFGLATASKWMGIVGWGAAGLWALWMMHSVHRQSSIPERLSAAFRLGVSLILVPIVAYFSTFLPFLFFHLQTPWTLLDFFKAQARMLDGQLRVVTQHPYHSDWKSWPWMTRPIWYVYDKEASKAGFVRGVIMLGNPAVMWPGLLAWLGCIGLAFKGPGRWRQVGAFVAGGWAILYFCWGIIPRKISFYYYYYPAALFLSLALAACFEAATDLGATRVQDTTLREIWKARIQILQAAYLLVVVGLFLHFLPILAAFRIPADSFRHWMWMRSWI
jgi:dolichyl-phosphate-mannose--protein O-mannosyl transferase